MINLTSGHCKQCSQVIVFNGDSPKQFCNRSCHLAYRSEHILDESFANCITCGKRFSVRSWNKGMYCSHTCSAQSQMKRIQLSCKQCAKTFYRRPCELDKLKNKDELCCSQTCYMRLRQTKRILVPCHTCGAIVSRTAHELKTSPSGFAFCSRKHYGEYLSECYRKRYPDLPVFDAKKENARLRLGLRYKACLKVDPSLRCKGCGCDDFMLLEISHENNDGGMERRYYKENFSVSARTQFLKDIISGARSTDDLALRCKLCNLLYYLIGVIGIDPHKFEIKFNAQLPDVLNDSYISSMVKS